MQEEQKLKQQMKTYKKLKYGPMVTETYEKKQYIDELSLERARELFKYRSEMFNVKFNYKNENKYKEDLWRCSSCQKCIETQTHVLFCEAYSPLREEKSLDSDSDLAEYLQKVLIIRDKLKVKK